MAGAGFKTFNTGDVLTASDVNTYLMQQTVMVFDDAAARTTALTGVVAEGMLSYLKDTNAVEVYDGSSWVASDDPNAIQNSIVDAKGDLISATADNTPARLAVGADNTVLTADSSTSTGLKWAASSSGALTKITSGSFSSVASVTVDNCFTSTYSRYMVMIRVTVASAGSDIQLQGRYGSTTVTSGYYGSAARLDRNNSVITAGYVGANQATLQDSSEASQNNDLQIYFDGVAIASTNMRFWGSGFIESGQSYSYFAGRVDNQQNYHGFVLLGTSNITGTYKIYALEN